MNALHLKFEIVTRTPKGGQHVGVDPQRIQITHIPTGIQASCDFERSIARNKNTALAMIEMGLAELGWKD